MIEQSLPDRGDCSKRALIKSGACGVQPQLDNDRHSDHEISLDAPPIGRGLEDRLGVISRLEAIEQQGGIAALGMLRAMNQTRRAKRTVVNTEGVPWKDTSPTMDPQTGETDAMGLLERTLWEIQEELRCLCQEKQFVEAIRLVQVVSSANPAWRVALQSQLEFETRGARRTPPSHNMR